MIEILSFRLAEGASEEEFLRADKAVQEDFAYQQPGLLRRTTARGADGAWAVIDLWASAAAADACESRWGADPVAQKMMALVDRESVRVERYHERD